MTTLDPSAIRIAVRHLAKYGDTDLFPPLPEIRFLRDDEETIVQCLSKVEPGSYTAMTATNSLAPKGRFGFRSAHQLGLTDNLLLLAATIQIGPEIEKLRLPDDAKIAFSYRFSPTDNGDIFSRDRTYRDWLQSQYEYLRDNRDYKYILKTDISDFYQRVYTHRLEGFFGDIASATPASSFIVKIIKAIRGKESFGLPVGGVAARLLAELSLRDVDKVLFEEGVPFTRYVDDYRFYVDDEARAYDTLALLADALLTEGLSLNSAKTAVVPTAKYLNEIEGSSADIFSHTQLDAIITLTELLYEDDEPSPESIAVFQEINLVTLLSEELDRDEIDYAKVKRILRAVRVVHPEGAIALIESFFPKLLPVAKELVLILEEAKKNGNDEQIAGLRPLFLKYYAEPPARNIAIIRGWLMEAFLRGVFDVTVADLKNLAPGPNARERPIDPTLLSSADAAHDAR